MQDRYKLICSSLNFFICGDACSYYALLGYARYVFFAKNRNRTERLKNRIGRKGKGDDVNSVMREVYRHTDGIRTATIRVYTQPMISGYGMSNGFEPYVLDKKGGSVEDLPKYVIILF